MVRNCPKCKESTVSVLRLLFTLRAKCKSCKSKVGVHWIYAAFVFCVLFVVMVLLALPLMISLPPFVGAIVIFILLLSFIFAAIYFGPLEEKSSSWTP